MAAAAGVAAAAPWIKVGNPGLNQFPANDTLDCTARSVWDMEYYDGKIYVGTGDAGDNCTSRIGGKLNVWTMAMNETFAKEYAVDEEMIMGFRQYGGKIFIPGTDPTESWDWGNLYVGNHGSWQKFRTLPNGVHCWDFAVFNNNYYAITSDDVGSFHIVESTNQGQSWATVSTTDQRYIYALIPEDGYMLAPGTIANTNQPNAPVIWKYLPDGTRQQFLTPNNGMCANGFDKQVTFQGHVIHTMPLWTHFNPEFSLREPNGLWSLDLSNLQAGSSAVARFANAYVQDIVARNDRCYVLTAAEISRGQEYKGQIWGSSDLQNWNLLADFNVSAIPTSFELTAANTFYVGLGNGNNGDVDNQAFAESGSILRIVTPEPSSLMLCLTGSLALLVLKQFHRSKKVA
jgi:hypothetical protein